jgi:response regulator RpfG family c-di-GMP phosphodiesterase
VTKVLYVEHDDDNLYMLKMRLERVGDFEVLAAEDSEKGCKLAATEHPDVILMDLEMPVVDRWEPVRRLRNGPHTHDIPIIGKVDVSVIRGRAAAPKPVFICYRASFRRNGNATRTLILVGASAERRAPP